MVEFIQHHFCRPLGGYGLFQCFSHPLANRGEGKTDEQEQKKGQKIWSGQQPAVGGEKHCNAQRGTENSRVKPGATIKNDSDQKNSGKQKEEREDPRLQLNADLKGEANQHDERRHTVPDSDALGPVWEQKEKV